MDQDAIINSGFRGLAISIMFAIVYLAFLIVRAIYRKIKQTVPKSIEEAARSAGAASAAVEKRLSAAKVAFKDGRINHGNENSRVDSRLPPVPRKSRPSIEVVDIEPKPKRISFFTIATTLLLALLLLTFLLQGLFL